MTARGASPARPLLRSFLVALVVMTALLVPATTSAQAPGTPTPAATAMPAASAPPIIGSGDPRSEGEGPGIVGSPVAIAIGVVVLGLLTALSTVLVVRIGGSRRGR